MCSLKFIYRIITVFLENRISMYKRMKERNDKQKYLNQIFFYTFNERKSINNGYLFCSKQPWLTIQKKRCFKKIMKNPLVDIVKRRIIYFDTKHFNRSTKIHTQRQYQPFDLFFYFHLPSSLLFGCSTNNNNHSSSPNSSHRNQLFPVFRWLPLMRLNKRW